MIITEDCRNDKSTRRKLRNGAEIVIVAYELDGKYIQIYQCGIGDKAKFDFVVHWGKDGCGDGQKYYTLRSCKSAARIFAQAIERRE